MDLFKCSKCSKKKSASNYRVVGGKQNRSCNKCLKQQRSAYNADDRVMSGIEKSFILGVTTCQ